MPTYEYRCPACGHQFEKFEKITAKTRPKCPNCGTRAQRVISGGAGLLFKGSGFYITDYKRGPGGEKGQEKAKETDKPKSEKPETKKSETKTSSEPSGSE